MKVLWILLLTFSLAGQSRAIAQGGAAQSKGQPPYFTLSIKAPQSVIKIDQKPIIMLTMKNTSSLDLHPDYLFGYTIRDSAGKPVPEVKNNEPGFVSSGSYSFILLRPGQSTTGPIDLSKKFAITKPGNYSVQVWREYYEPHTNRVLGCVKSNVITIKILE